MSRKRRPRNYAELLVETVAIARQCRFWKAKLGNRPIISVSDFESLPFTTVAEYRDQSFGSVVADADEIEWIPGPWLGQLPNRVPMAEGPAEAKVRVELMTDALQLALPGEPRGASALIVAESERRHFGAEVCAVFARIGVRAHLLTEDATDRLGELIRAFAPDVLVALSSAVGLHSLPDSVTGIVSVGKHMELVGKRHVGLFVCNELGVLGYRIGTERFELSHDRFHFEESPEGTLAVTPYFSRVQPVIRLDTGIYLSVLH